MTDIRYKIYESSGTTVIFDRELGVFFGESKTNQNYIEYLGWLKLGNEPEPEHTLDERREILINATIKKSKSVESGGILMQLGRKKAKTHLGSGPSDAEKYARHASSIRRGIDLTEFTVLSNERKPAKLNKDALNESQKLCSHLHEKCEQRCAELIEEISKSNSPEEVDIESGWPDTPYEN